MLGGERVRRWWQPRRSALPLAERLPQGLGTWLACGFLAMTGLAGAVYGGHIQTLTDHYGEPRHALARALGLGIDRITISGLVELHEVEVLQAAGISPLSSLAFFDASEARRALEATPLIREASVRKLYPGEVSIHVVERDPFALWQLNGEVSLVAADGTVIDKLRDARFAHLPLVVGDGANLKAKDYAALIASAGQLREQIRGATLVSGRRWNLKMHNGVDVKLPEIGAAEALARLATLDREQKLLDKDVLAIDLRQPDRITLRLTEEAAAARLEKSKPKKKGGEA